MTSRTTDHTLREVVFLVLLLALYVSQVFLVVPGANLDAANYGHYDTINFLGLSYSSWLSLILICWCTISVLMNLGKLRFTRPSLLCLLAIAGFTVIGALNSSVSGIADLGVKMLMPFTAYFYIRYVLIELESREIDRLLLAINLFLIGQVLICKLITGEFSANHYYTYIMDEEYFGYYNSPHPFTAMLGLLSIWNLRIIALRKAPVVHVLLVAGNVTLMLVSGVRTYLLGLVFSVVFLLIMALFRSDLKKFRPLIAALIFVLLCFSGQLSAFLSGTRLSSSYNTTELTSGRSLRWALDMGEYLGESTFRILFGGGFAHSYDVNTILIGVHINSLNFVVDVLLDNGIFGLLTLLIAYLGMLTDLFKKGNFPFLAALAIYLLVGMTLNNLLPYVTVTLAAVLILVSWQREGRMQSVLEKGSQL